MVSLSCMWSRESDREYCTPAHTHGNDSVAELQHHSAGRENLVQLVSHMQCVPHAINNHYINYTLLRMNKYLITIQ